ncbi:MAG TPA: hypothetical protein PKX74_07550 [Leptospiraceae bacterium]|nr:hypothetical protein [Leptospiraceae bacterium]
MTTRKQGSRQSAGNRLLQATVLLCTLVTQNAYGRTGALYAELGFVQGAYSGQGIRHQTQPALTEISQLTFLRASGERQSLLLLESAAAPDVRARGSGPRFAFEYFLFPWLEIGRSFEPTVVRVHDVVAAQKLIWQYRAIAPAVGTFYSSGNLNGADFLGFQRSTVKSQAYLGGGYEAAVYLPFWVVSPFARLSADPFSGYASVAAGVKVFIEKFYISAEGVASRQRVPLRNFNGSFTYRRAEETGFRICAGYRIH